MSKKVIEGIVDINQKTEMISTLANQVMKNDMTCTYCPINNPAGNDDNDGCNYSSVVCAKEDMKIMLDGFVSYRERNGESL